jgi:hypothetical protein
MAFGRDQQSGDCRRKTPIAAAAARPTLSRTPKVAIPVKPATSATVSSGVENGNRTAG